MSAVLRKTRITTALTAVLLLVGATVAWGAPGDPLTIGQANDGGGATTSLTSTSGTGTLRVFVTGGGSGPALRADAENAGNGIVGGTQAPGRYGFRGANFAGKFGGGAGVFGDGRQNHGVVATTNNASDAYAVVATHNASGGTAIRGEATGPGSFGVFSDGDLGTSGALVSPGALNVRVQGRRALRLEPGAVPNVIGGWSGNTVDAGLVGATIGGGGCPASLCGTNRPNQVTGDFGIVGGGYRNTAGSEFATVGGGADNTASGFLATVGGGDFNTASGSSATVGGGGSNIASGSSATVGGGRANTASGVFAAVAGGHLNSAAGQYSFAAGRRAKANHDGALVWADSQDADFASTMADQFNIRALNGVRVFSAGNNWNVSTSNGDLFIGNDTYSLRFGLATGGGGAGDARIFSVGPGTDRVIIGPNVEVPGNLHVQGTLTKSAGSFRIDHPLDPANSYLSHSFVESPDMKNIYDGVVRTDDRGRAVVRLPEYFGALNTDYRYQLTTVGTFARAMVAQEIEGNRFVIRTSKPGVEVSWQVTGIRNDPYARAHPIEVEAPKPPGERGTYLFEGYAG